MHALTLEVVLLSGRQVATNFNGLGGTIGRASGGMGDK